MFHGDWLLLCPISTLSNVTIVFNVFVKPHRTPTPLTKSHYTSTPRSNPRSKVATQRSRRRAGTQPASSTCCRPASKWAASTTTPTGTVKPPRPRPHKGPTRAPQGPHKGLSVLSLMTLHPKQTPCPSPPPLAFCSLHWSLLAFAPGARVRFGS